MPELQRTVSAVQGGQSLLLLYDFLQILGGAEKVLQTLQGHTGADVCVGFANRSLFNGSFSESRLKALTPAQTASIWGLLGVLRAFSNAGPKVVGRYQAALYSGSYAVLAHSAAYTGRSIYYCHTPPRFLYDLKAYYAQNYSVWQRPLLAALRQWLQPRYEKAVRNMDVVLANSENVRRRLQQYVNVDATVVYPPVDLDAYTWRADGDYFVSTARLEPLKRVEAFVLAFKKMPQEKLVVASGGSELERLRRLAEGAPNIRFTGWLDDASMQKLVGEARATLYAPVDEDFGMSPVESMAAGKPVIGVAEGGLLETVLPNETGFLMRRGCATEDICEAVNAMTATKAQGMRTACENRAKLFSKKRFLLEMNNYLGDSVDHADGLNCLI